MRVSDVISDLKPVNQSVVDHYAIAAAILERLFGAVPFEWLALPHALRGARVFHGPLSEKTRTKRDVVEVPLASGVRRYPQLSASRIEGLVAKARALEFYSWSPTASDPMRVAFARLLVEESAGVSREVFSKALLATRDVLEESGVRSVLVFDGGRGAACWIPFDDAPTYPQVRAWLHDVCARAVEEHGDLFTLEPDSHGGTCAHLHCASNAPGRFSILPYSVRAGAGYPLALPVPWEEAERFENGTVSAGELEGWLAQHGEVFAREREAIGEQRFASVAGSVDVPTSPLALMTTAGPIIAAAIAVLQDGQSHSAAEILQMASERGLLDAKASQKYVYTSLIEYIARAKGNGRTPKVVQNPDRTFRVNEPEDLWPQLSDEQARELRGADAVASPAIESVIASLMETAKGSDAAAFEQAVCAAFEALGFHATHCGGYKAPDGYADAPLGPLGYRVMLECKSASQGLNKPDVLEAAKFKDAYRAQHCAMIARAYADEVEFTSELHNHGVSAWTVDDLAAVLRAGANPREVESLFAPGYAADGVEGLLWERAHGTRKRVLLVADAILRCGWATQSAYCGTAENAPHFTEDVAMVLVDEDLAAQGSSARCDRGDVQAAISYLSNPMVQKVELCDDGSFIVEDQRGAES